MDKMSERRLVENELLFRSANRRVQKHVQSERGYRTAPDTTKLRFYCECSNVDCQERISLTVDEYHTAGPGRKEFIVKPGHQDGRIEKIVRTEKMYLVVEKHLDPVKITAEY